MIKRIAVLAGLAIISLVAVSIYIVLSFGGVYLVYYAGIQERLGASMLSMLTWVFGHGAIVVGFATGHLNWAVAFIKAE